MTDGWRDVKSMPTAPGTRIRALVETELEREEWRPALLMGGWRRVAARDRIVGWLPPMTEDGEKP